MNALNSLREETNEVMRKSVEYLLTERDNMREEAKYAESTILELEAQNLKLHYLLSQAQACLETIIPVVPVVRSSPNISWIRSIWLSSTANPTLLKPVETAWQKGDTQRALILLHIILNRVNLTSSQRAEATLLQATIVSCSGCSEQALPSVENALKIATEKQLYDLVGKAQFIRGRCYIDLERYADARWCFVLASHTKGYEAMIENDMQLAEQQLSELPAGHVGRSFNLPSL